MSNLLPAAEIRLAARLYRARRLEVAGALAAALLVVGLVLAGAIYFLVRIKRTETLEALKTRQAATQQTQADAASKILVKFEKRLAALTQITDPHQTPMALWALTEVARPAGVGLDGWRYDKLASGPVIELAGRAATRADLLALIKNLEQVPLFAAVESPVSNLVRNRDLDFALTVKLKKK